MCMTMKSCKRIFNHISRSIKNDINSHTSWPSASEKFLIQAMFSSTVGKLAKSDEIMGRISAVFLIKEIKTTFHPLVTNKIRE